jgi:hypothetical protein
MNTISNAINDAVREISRLGQNLKKSTTRQVNSIEEQSLIKATGGAWFNNHRKIIAQVLDNELLKDTDELYKCIILASDRATTRSKYISLLKSVKKELSKLRGHTITISSQGMGQKTADSPPNFSSLIADPIMQRILTDRWVECINCIKVNAPLAATVMMGGVLEGLLLARINRENNKAAIFQSSKAPKDNSTKKVLPLKEWTLRNFIDVAHELRWISQSTKDVGEVLRDYRNYIHPQKQLSHNIVIGQNDAILFWEITKSICRQIL